MNAAVKTVDCAAILSSAGVAVFFAPKNPRRSARKVSSEIRIKLQFRQGGSALMGLDEGEDTKS